ncbi:MAG TPA: hypothetical protein VLF43_00165 [Candidatus Saccharimonadales bacterium]|nr:hypothetical protein [Candidatus Saccharimonadales bacterium]
MAVGPELLFDVSKDTARLRPDVISVGQHIAEILAEHRRPHTAGLLWQFNNPLSVPGWLVNRHVTEKPMKPGITGGSSPHPQISITQERYALFIGPEQGLLCCSQSGHEWAMPPPAPDILSVERLARHDDTLARGQVTTEAQVFSTHSVIKDIENFAVVHGIHDALRQRRSV